MINGETKEYFGERIMSKQLVGFFCGVIVEKKTAAVAPLYYLRWQFLESSTPTIVIFRTSYVAFPIGRFGSTGHRFFSEQYPKDGR